MVQYVADEQAIGKIEGDIGSLITKRWAEGDIEGLVRDKSFGIILLALFGAVSSAVKETTAYDHTFSVSQSVQHPSLTIYIQHPAGAYKYALGMVNSLEITAEVGNFVKYTVGFLSKESAASAESPFSVPQPETMLKAANSRKAAAHEIASVFPAK